MKSVLEILNNLKKNGILVSLDDAGTNLRLKGNLNLLNEEAKTELKENKSLILEFLREQFSGSLLEINRSANGSNLIPLAPNQKAIWIHEKISNIGKAYVIPAIIHQSIPFFEKETFLNALTFTVQENEVLRYIFKEYEGVPYQEIIENLDFEKHFTIHQALTKSELGNKIIEIGNGSTFNYDQPLWSLDIFPLPESEFCIFLRLHHLIGDGESISLFMKSLLQNYQTLQNGISLTSDTNLRYRDYVEWILNKKNFEPSTKYWKQTFLNYEENFNLIPDSIEEDLIKDCVLQYEFSFELNEDLKACAVKNRVSYASLLTSICSIVLSKRGRSNDFVIGIPTASRNHPQLNNIMGDLVNTVPIRIQIDYSQPISSYCKQIQNIYLSALDHQLYPFEYIIDDIDYQRKINVNPLFNVMVSVPNGLTYEDNPDQDKLVNKTGSLYDLTFTFIEYKHKTKLVIEFDPTKFNKCTIDNIFNELIAVVQQFTSNKEIELSKISLLNAEKVHKDLAISNQNNYTNTVLDLLQKVEREKTNNIAIVDGERQLSYRQFLNEINAFSSFLINQYDIVSGDFVVVNLDSSYKQIIAQYAIWKLGAVYVPIATNLPDERRNSVIEDCNAKLCITEGVLELYKSEKHRSVNETLTKTRPTDLAYILYTSGTSGKPKGVKISHSNLYQKMIEEAEILSINENSNTYTLTSIGFDVSFLESVLPLSFGGKVYIASKEALKDVQVASIEIVNFNISILQGTPTYFSHWISELSENSINSLTNLKQICIGGESLHHYLVQELRNKLPNTIINNHYGPTEITIDAFVKKDVKEFTQNLIGFPIGETKAFIVDEFENLLPTGVVGELVIAGPCVFEGYLNDEELTNQKLKHLPFVDYKCYFTGDLASLRENGEVKFFGRKDLQVKYRGYRIELEEINYALMQHKRVSGAYTRVVDNLLISWILGKNIDVFELQNQMRTFLPEYMIPQSIQILDEFPLTSNGKIADKFLPIPQILHQEYIAPSTNLEIAVSAIWKEVLSVERVGINDDFFVLGGHSLKLTQLQSRYLSIYKVSLSFTELFTHTTLASHVKLIEASALKKFDEILQAPKMEDYPVTYSQHRLWLLSQLDGGLTAYNMPATFKIQGELDVDKFCQAIQSLVDRYEILRTTFVLNQSNELRQLIKDQLEANFNVEFVTGLDSEREILDDIEASMNEHFDLESGPLFKVKLFRLNTAEYVLFYNIHHIIADGWSIDLMLKEIISLYLGNQLEELNIQYKDFAYWQQKTIGTSNESEIYWKSKFSGDLPVLNFPVQKTRPSIQSFNGNILEINFNEDLTSKLKAYCLSKKGTLYIGLLAGLNGVINRYTLQSDIIIGCPLAGRQLVELENQIGMFVNTLALRTEFSSQDSFDQLFENVKKVTLEAYEHQEYPFDKLIDDLNLKRNISRNPLFDFMLVLQNTSGIEGPKIQNDEFELFEISNPHHTSHFDITFSFVELDEKLVGKVEYNTDIFETDFIEKFLQHFTNFLDSALEFPAHAIGTFDILSTEERIKIVDNFHHFENIDDTINVLSLLEEQVVTNPNSVALVYEHERLTYRELDNLSTKLANVLFADYHIQPGNRVGIMMERSNWIVVSIIAILKLRATYVPLDAEYPAERLQYMIQDSQCLLVITMDLIDEFVSRKVEDSSMINVGEIDKNEIVYIIYTSGSTGQPKGIKMPHRVLTNLIVAHNKMPIAHERVTQFTSVSFDVSFQEIFFTLTRGGELHILSEECRKTPDQLITYVNDNDIRTMFLPTSYFKFLANENHLMNFQGVRDIVVAGEKLIYSKNILEFLKSKNTKLHNHYGPAETHVVTEITIDANSLEELEKAPSIGKPIQNAHIYVFNDCFQFQPIGVEGEIYIGGDVVASGYWNKENLTRERFIQSPFDNNQIIYKTGDIAKWNSDGTIEYVGRNDDQVKIRGYRIELDEVRKHIVSLLAVKDALITVVEQNGEKQLCAYVLTDLLIERKDLRKHMPEFMIPTYIIPLNEFPLNANGKIDRKALPLPELAIKDNEILLPRTMIEHRLIEIWKDVLGIKNMGISDDFFDLGGSSLKAISVIGKIYKEIGYKLSLNDLYRHSSVIHLAELLADQSNVLENSTFEPIPLAKKSHDYPLTRVQERFWRIQQTPNNCRHNITNVLSIKATINEDKLIKAYSKLQEKHSALNLIFSEIDGTPKQKYTIQQNIDTYFKITDLQLVQDKAVKLEELFDGAAKYVFNLEVANHYLHLIKFAEDHYYLLLNIHHIVADLWSLKILFNDLFELYSDNELGHDRIEFHDFVVWSNNHLEENKSRYENYWFSQFADEKLPVLHLNYRTPVEKSKSPYFHFNWSEDETTKIHAYINQKGISLYSFLLATTYILLSKTTGDKDIIIASPTAGRSHPDTENLVGVFINMLPFRYQIDEHKTIAVVLEEVRELVFSNLEHQLFPLENLIDHLEQNNRLSSGTLFDVTVVLQNVEIKNDESTTSISELVSNESHDNLSFLFSEDSRKLSATIEFDIELFEYEQIVEMSHQLKMLVTQAIENDLLQIAAVELDTIMELEK